MPGRSVDVVAAGPPPVDPFGPGASAWTLAAAFAARGDDVHVLHLAGSVAAPPPDGVTATAVEIPLRRPGAPVEPAEFAAAAGRRVRKDADLVWRDPVGLGALGLPRHRRGPPVVGAFVRSLELRSFEGQHRTRASTGVVDRLDTWRDHRAVRRLERAALEEADRLFYEAPAVAQSLTEEYGVPSRKLAQLPSAVPLLPPGPTRERSRRDLRIPNDVLVVVALAGSEDLEASGTDRVLEAFRRVRPFFPGVRLVVWGVPAPSDPGVVNVPDRTATNVAVTLASGDVALFAGRTPGFDPGVVLAARASLPSIVLPSLGVPVASSDGLRVTASDDPGDVASALAELLADPAAAREVGGAARRFAEPFHPDRLADDLSRATAPVAA